MLESACVDARISYRKLKTPVKTRFASKVILFQKTIEYQNVVNLCYERQETQELHVPNAHTWACKMVVEIMFLVMK
jgi:hypothetical protein